MPLDATRARRFYDRVGRALDTQRFYEDVATTRLMERAAFGDARAVFELGCGTGRFAARLLAGELADTARYLGVDVSPRMVGLARARLASWAPRAEVALVEPPARVLPGADGSFDRFVATYVFDLLSDDDAHALLGEAHRLLAPYGMLALAGLTHGDTGAARFVSAAWGALARRRPGLVGGCRPIRLETVTRGERFRVVHRELVTGWGVPSEVVIASRDGSG